MYYERTITRTFTVECDYCKRKEIVEVQADLKALLSMYDKVRAAGWDLSGPYDRCDKCAMARAESMRITR
jgi:hypothetical protein